MTTRIDGQVGEVRGHTPGPWRANSDQPNNGYRRVFMPNDLVQIETDGPRGQMVACLFKENFAHGQDEANARLIASAPELLDALRGMLTATDHWNDWEPGAKEREIAKAIIAKATAP